MSKIRIVWWTVYILVFAVWYAVSRNSVMLLPVTLGGIMLLETIAERRMRLRSIRKKKAKEIK